MRKGTLGAPLDVVASVFLDKEGLGAALVAVGVDALLDREVEDRAFRDGVGRWSEDVRISTTDSSGVMVGRGQTYTRCRPGPDRLSIHFELLECTLWLCFVMLS